MAKEAVPVDEQISEYREVYGLRQKIPCTGKQNREYARLVKSGQPLPENVHAYEYDDGSPAREFYTLYAPEMTHPQVMEYLAYRQLDMLRTIRNCLVFFTVLTLIGLAAWCLIAPGLFR